MASVKTAPTTSIAQSTQETEGKQQPTKAKAMNTHITNIARFIEAQAPDVQMEEVRNRYYEGVQDFIVTYGFTEFECERRMGVKDTSNYHYYNGTGDSETIVYDEIVVLKAYDTVTGDEYSNLVTDINLMLC